MQMDCPERLQPAYLDSNRMVAKVGDLNGGTVIMAHWQDGVQFRLLGCGAYDYSWHDCWLFIHVNS